MNQSELVFEKGKKPRTILVMKKLYLDVMKHKIKYAIVLPVALVVAIIYAWSVPEWYTCPVKLSPEISPSVRDQVIMSLTARNIKVMNRGYEEAITPILYPELVNSVEFRISLLNVNVRQIGDDREITYYEHLLFDQKQPWWSGWKDSVLSWIKSVFRGSMETVLPTSIGEVDTFRLTDLQDTMIGMVAGLVKCEVDPQSLCIVITVKDQDPFVCAQLADSAQMKLRQFITAYRTSKARIDYDYYDKIFKDARIRYREAMDNYAAFADANRDSHLEIVNEKKKSLESEANLQYQIYSKMSEKRIDAYSKIQEEKPVFAVLESATVPTQYSSPNRIQLCVIVFFLSVLITSLWVFYKEGDLKLFLIGWP